MSETKYIVAWQSKVSLAHGKQGKPMSYEDAVKECAVCNRMHGDQAHYYPQRYDSFKKKFLNQNDE